MNNKIKSTKLLLKLRKHLRKVSANLFRIIISNKSKLTYEES